MLYHNSPKTPRKTPLAECFVCWIEKEGKVGNFYYDVMVWFAQGLKATDNKTVAAAPAFPFFYLFRS